MALAGLVASSTKTKTAEAHSSTIEPTTVVRLRTTTTNVTSAPLNVTPTEKPNALPSAPVEVITPAPADLNLENPKLRRMQQHEITKDMLETAAKIVRKHYAKPVGTQIEVEVDGKHVTARIERHFHPEGGPVKPWGYHPGVSLFVHR